LRYRPVSHVIYDMDGLLLATEQLYTEAMRVVLARYGRELDWSLKAQIIGLQAIESARHTVATLGLPVTADVYLNERNRELEPRLASAEAKPGARELVEHLHRNGVPQVVATSSSRALAALKIAGHTDWFRLFEHLVSVDDPGIERGKPHPDVFLAAARLLGAAPSACLVFEDSPAGVAAARGAGMSVVAVPEPEIGHERVADADQVLESLEAFEPECWGLPGRESR
jgi:pseudouridine 5'-phosphatase